MRSVHDEEGSSPEAHAPFEITTTIRRRDLRLLWLAGAPLALAIAWAWWLSPREAPPPLDLCVNLLLAGVLLFSILWAAKPAAQTRRARVRGDRHGLWVDGRLLLRRVRIAAAFLEPGPDGLVCTCSGPLGTSRTEVRVEGEEQGRRLLRALSFDASQRTVRFAGPSPMTTTRTGRLVAFGAVTLVAVLEYGLLCEWGHASLGPFALALWCLQAWLLAGGTVRVGADGLLVQSLWSRRFLAHGDIERVRAEATCVRLVLRGGGRLDLWLGVSSGGSSRRRDALVARIATELRERAARPGPPPEVAMVGREGRTTAQWVEHLRELVGASGAPYRTAAVERELLWRIAEDASAPTASRAGAAVALRDALKPGERVRLRVAAEAAAAPDVRAAFEAAADESCDDRALLAKLDPIARGDRSPRPREPQPSVG